jgi:hypothetical protein
MIAQSARKSFGVCIAGESSQGLLVERQSIAAARRWVIHIYLSTLEWLMEYTISGKWFENQRSATSRRIFPQSLGQLCVLRPLGGSMEEI